MSSNDKIEGLISSVGSIAEMCKIFYDSCILSAVEAYGYGTDSLDTRYCINFSNSEGCIHTRSSGDEQ